MTMSLVSRHSIRVLTSTCLSAAHRTGEESLGTEEKSKVKDHFKVKGNRKGKVWHTLLKRLLVWLPERAINSTG